MRIPPPKPRVDVAAAHRALARGETIAAFARRTGFTAKAVGAALRRDGNPLPRVRRTSTDRRLYSLWRSLLSRCERPADPKYRIYGARAIRVCRAWHEFAAFERWARASGYRPGKGITLHVRSRGYRPSNCSWVPASVASRDGLMAAGRGVTAFGETKSVEAWSRDRRARVNAQTIRDRIRAGVPAELAITAPRKRVKLGTVTRARRYTRIDWRRARKLHVTEGLAAAEVARRLGASPKGVIEGLRRRGWLHRPTPIRELGQGRELHTVWSNLRDRRGEGSLVPAWRSFAGFHAWAIRAGYRPGLVLTRIDRGAPYSPRNCRWLLRREALAYGRPSRVRRTPRWTITAFGETKGPTAWARDPRCTVTASGLIARLKRGLTPRKAITARKRREGVEPAGKAVEAFGQVKSQAAWARDRRARVGAGAIAARLRAGMPAEKAIATPAFRR